MEDTGITLRLLTPEEQKAKASVGVCRISTGELIIAEFGNPGSEEIQLIDPVMVEVHGTPKGPQIGMGALIPLGLPGDSITINEDHIQFWVDKPNPALLERYADVRTKLITARGIVQ
jgi:hypothetical protein